MNCTCAGEPLANLDNVISAMWQLIELLEGRIKFILTSIGLEDKLRIFLDRYVNLPGLRHYWSGNSFRPEIRHIIMPITRKHNFFAIRDLYEEIANVTGEKVTFSITHMSEFHDLKKEVKAARELILNRPFIVKLQPFSGAPGFRPFKTVTNEKLELFQKMLEDAGMSCRTRHVIGGDCYGGCGTTMAGRYSKKRKRKRFNDSSESEMEK